MATSPGLPLSKPLSKARFAPGNSRRLPAGTGASPYLVRTDGHVPLHCGTPMEWSEFVPAQSMVLHTFDTEREASTYPPVWRCGCGFQLDAQPAPASAMPRVRYR
jgi:hypothetical protein